MRLATQVAVTLFRISPLTSREFGVVFFMLPVLAMHLASYFITLCILVQTLGWMGSLYAALAVTSAHGQHSGKS